MVYSVMPTRVRYDDVRTAAALSVCSFFGTRQPEVFQRIAGAVASAGR